MRNRPILPRLRPAAAAAALVLVCAAPLRAQPARLSADLSQALAAGAASIDVIVHGDTAEVQALAARHGATILKFLKTGGVLRVNAAQLASLQLDGSQDHLSSDVPIRSTAIVAAQTILADRVWSGSDGLPPLSGVGVGVALIDSGVDARHEALADRVAVSVDFTGGDGVDRFGHGTHVAAIIAGQTSWLPDGTEYRGIAPDAHVVNLRVLDETGSGRASSVIEAIDWVIANQSRYQIRIINLSIGAPVLQPYRDDPLCEAVERAVAAGLLVVASAGNQGGRLVYGGITSPGNDPDAISVGALETNGTPMRVDDTVAMFSARGPTAYDLVVKPDLVAPGSGVLSAEAADAFLPARFPDAHVVGRDDHGYMRLTGTSMAAAVISGAAALLLEQEPSLTPAAIKGILQATSAPTVEGPLAGGAGSANVMAAAMLVQTLIDASR